MAEMLKIVSKTLFEIAFSTNKEYFHLFLVLEMISVALLSHSWQVNANKCAWLVELMFNTVSNFQLLILKFRKDKPV